MKYNFYFKLILTIAFFLMKKVILSNAKITINLNGINNNKGEIRLALFRNKLQFLKTPYKGVTSNITASNAMIVLEEIPEGEYAIAVFHDENTNGKLDTNFLGIPKEQYGFSNHAKGQMKPPKFEDAKFKLTNEQNKFVTINMK